jgi:hypothetical protein
VLANFTGESETQTGDLMSHHVSAGATNPTGAVEVVRVSNPATTTAPVDGGGAAATGAVGAGVPATSATPTAVSTSVTGQSGAAGANLPVPEIEQASNTIQNAKADLSATTGAERRLDGFDLVGGGGGGGGGGGAEQAGVDDANTAEDDVAAGTADLNVSESGVGGDRVTGEQALTSTAADAPTAGANPQTDVRSVV